MFNIQDYWKKDTQELELKLKDGNKLTVFIGDLNEAYCLTVTDKQDNLILDGASFFDADESGNYIIHELTNDVLNDMLCDLGICYVEGYSCSVGDIVGLWDFPLHQGRLIDLVESYMNWHNTHEDYFTYYHLANGKYVGIWISVENGCIVPHELTYTLNELAEECFSYMWNCNYFDELEDEDLNGYDEWHKYYFGF